MRSSARSPSSVLPSQRCCLQRMQQKGSLFQGLQIHRVGEDSEEGDISVMTVNEVVNTIETSEKWRTNLLIGNSEINFKVDTGADVTVIPEKVFRQCLLAYFEPTRTPLTSFVHSFRFSMMLFSSAMLNQQYHFAAGLHMLLLVVLSFLRRALVPRVVDHLSPHPFFSNSVL